MNGPNGVYVRFATLLELEVVSRYNYIARTAGVERVQKLIERQQVFVAESSAQFMGYAFVDYINVVSPFLALIWVFEPYRQHGVGRSLLMFIEAQCRSHGHTFLYSSSQANEPEPQAWHRHMGFQECGFISGEETRGIGEVYFRKRL